MIRSHSHDQDSAYARPPSRFDQVLRARFRDVPGDNFEPPGNQTPDARRRTLRCRKLDKNSSATSGAHCCQRWFGLSERVLGVF
jgi:hypothetical protein